MAIRGENIGTAYVRILADGSTFDESVREQIEDGIDWDDLGRKGQQEWQDGWEEEAKKNANQKRLRESIAKPLHRGDWLTTTFFRGRNWQRFRSGLFNEFGEAGKRAADNMEKSLYEGLSFSGLSSRLDNIIPDIVRAQKELDRELSEQERDAQAERERNLNNWFKNQLQGWKRYSDSVIKTNLDMDRDLERHWSELAERAQQQAQDRDRALELHWDNLARAARENALEMARIQDLGRMQERAITEDRRRTFTDLMDQYRAMSRHIEQLRKGENGWLVRIGKVTREFEDLTQKIKDTGLATDELNERFIHQQRILQRSHPFIDRLSTTAGKAFGYGSRNNFLNFIGSMTRGFTSMYRIIPATIRGITGVMGEFTDGFKQARAAGSGMFSALLAGGRSGGAALVSLGASAAVAAATLGAVLLAAGPVVSILSMLAGIVSALAGSLTFALVGALASTAAVMLPLAASIGAVVVAFQSMSDAQRDALKNSFQPLINDFRELGSVVRDAMFEDVGQIVAPLRRALEGLRPLARGVGAAVGDMAAGLARSMDTPAFDKFTRSMTEFLPNAVRSLGRVMENTFGGFGGLLRGMVPFMQDTLIWLENITDRFSRWANSARGQRDILNFFEQAKDSIRSVGNFLGEAWDFLWLILSQGAATGDSIFDKMAGGIEKATTWLQQNPDALQQWFRDAEKFASIIGDIIVAITKLVDVLDSPIVRGLVNTTFAPLAAAARGIGSAFQFTTGLTGALFRTLTGTEQKTATARQEFADFTGTLDRFTGKVTEATRELALLEFQKAGVTDEANRLNISMRDVIGASMGERDAIERVIEATKGLRSEQDKADARKLLQSLGLVSSTLDRNQDKFRETQLALQSWNEALAGIKDRQLRVAVKTEGMDMTMKDLVDLNRKFDLTPREIKTIVKSVGMDLTKKQSGKLVEALQLLDRQNPTPKAALDNKQLTAKQRESLRFLQELNNKRPIPLADLNTSRADAARQRLNKHLDDLDIKVAKPRAELDDQASPDIGKVRDDLGLIDRTVVSATVNVVGNALSTLSSIASRLGSIGGAAIDAVVNADKNASGTIVNGARLSWIGEEGPEAVVPLNRPLNQVDPAVRWLSAIAQGKSYPGMARGGVVGGGKTFNVEQHIYAPASDPRAVAAETVNRLVAVGY